MSDGESKTGTKDSFLLQFKQRFFALLKWLWKLELFRRMSRRECLPANKEELELRKLRGEIRSLEGAGWRTPAFWTALSTFFVAVLGWYYFDLNGFFQAHEILQANREALQDMRRIELSEQVTSLEKKERVLKDKEADVDARTSKLERDKEALASEEAAVRGKKSKLQQENVKLEQDLARVQTERLVQEWSLKVSQYLAQLNALGMNAENAQSLIQDPAVKDLIMALSKEGEQGRSLKDALLIDATEVAKKPFLQALCIYILYKGTKNPGFKLWLFQSVERTRFNPSTDFASLDLLSYGDWDEAERSELCGLYLSGLDAPTLRESEKKKSLLARILRGHPQAIHSCRRERLRDYTVAVAISRSFMLEPEEDVLTKLNYSAPTLTVLAPRLFLATAGYLLAEGEYPNQDFAERILDLVRHEVPPLRGSAQEMLPTSRSREAWREWVTRNNAFVGFWMTFHLENLIVSEDQFDDY